MCVFVCVCVTVSLQAIIIRTHYYEKTSYMLIVFEFSASIHLDDAVLRV